MSYETLQMKVMPHIYKFLIIIIFLSSSVSLSHADTLVLRSGNVVDGKILDINRHDIRFDPYVGVPIYFYYDEIFSINELSCQKFKDLFYQDKKDLLRFINRMTPKGVDLKPKKEIKELNPVHNSFKNFFDNFLRLKAEEDDLRLVEKGKSNNAENFSNPRRDMIRQENSMILNISVDRGSFERSEKVLENSILSHEDTTTKSLQSDEVEQNFNLSQSHSGVSVKIQGLREKRNSVDKKMFLSICLKVIKQIFRFEYNYVSNKITFLVKKFPTLKNLVALSLGEAHSFYVNKFSAIFVKKVLLIIALIIYISYCYPLMLVAKTFGLKCSWMAWLPVFQQILVIRMANKSSLFLILYLIPFIRFINIVYLWGEIANYLGKSRFFGFLMLLPGINIFTLWHFSFFNRKMIYKKTHV